MIKGLIEGYIRATKNSDFKFDSNISNKMIIDLFFIKTISLVKGLRFLTINKKFNKIFIGKKLKIYNKKNISVGNNVNIGDYVTLNALGSEGIKISDNVNIGSFSQLVISTSFNNIGSFIKLGKNVGFGEFSYLGGAGGLEIGEDTIIGQYFSAHPENHNFEHKDIPIRMQGVTRKGIKIGKNCWIGSKVTILDGVKIGKNSVIASGAVVNKSFGENVVIGGVPAKIIKEI